MVLSRSIPRCEAYPDYWPPLFILHGFAILFRLDHISLLQFRNYGKCSFSFPGQVVAICGPNGKGKTNLLDAIYYSCFTRSYFSRADGPLVKNGFEGFRLEAVFKIDGTSFQTTFLLRENGKKELYVDEEQLDRLSDLIGRFPAVMVCPDDTLMITGGSEDRRRYMDILFSQLDASYLQSLIRYNKVMVQRNNYLRQCALMHQFDSTLLDTLDAQLIQYGMPIAEKRQELLKELLPLTLEIYENIAGSRDSLTINYESQLMQGDFPSLLLDHRDKDRSAQRTLAGIHRDDLDFRLEDQKFKTVASQGQRKSLLFACKLAEFELLKNQKGFAPLLLLDDVFEKLDEKRMQNLLFKVCRENDGQVFLTDTHPERVKNYFNEMNVKLQLIVLDGPNGPEGEY